jgi:hypothetical protein
VRAPLICNFACNFRVTRQYFSSDVKIKGDVPLLRFGEKVEARARVRKRRIPFGRKPDALLLPLRGDKSICSKQKHTHEEAILNKAEAASYHRESAHCVIEPNALVSLSSFQID